MLIRNMNIVNLTSPLDLLNHEDEHHSYAKIVDTLARKVLGQMCKSYPVYKGGDISSITKKRVHLLPMLLRPQASVRAAIQFN